MLRLLPVVLLALVGADARAQGGLAPTDTTRWTEVPATSGTRVYVDAEVSRPTEDVAEVWTWWAYPAPRRARRGEPYDRVLTRARVFCRIQATAPLRTVRYLGRASVDSFLYPPSVGPFGWRPGSTDEAVAALACDTADPDAAGDPDAEPGDVGPAREPGG